MAQKKISVARYVRHLWNSVDLRRKILVTFLILAIFRLAANVPAPGVDSAALASITASATGFVGMLDMLSGGTISNFSLLSMGVYPYITAQIILQLLVPIIPALQKRMEDDPREGRKWMERWTYYLAVPMAALSVFGQISLFNTYFQTTVIQFDLFSKELWFPSLTTLVAMTGGTMFAIWLGELISEYGIRGQGLSLIIFAGIVSQMPSRLGAMMSDEQNRWFLLAFVIALIIITIFAIIYVQQGRRNVPVMYPGRRMGNRMSMPVKGTLPLLVNMAGMIPLIFAQALLQFPVIVSSYFGGSETAWVKTIVDWIQNNLNGTGGFYWGFYFFMVVSFTFFYTTVLFDQQNYGENLKRVGAQIPGINRGAPTQKYLKRVQSLITLPGALFLGIVAIMPYLVSLILASFNVGSSSSSAGLFLVTSSGLLIVVGVVRDTIMNIEAEMKLHGYEDTLLVK